MLVEEVSAQILTISLKKRVSLRLAASEFFSRRPDLEHLKPAVRVLTTEVARRFKLLDRAAEVVLGLDPCRLDPYRRNLLRVLVFESMYRDIPLSRIEKVSLKLGLGKAQVRKLRETDERALLRGLSYVERLSVKYSVPRWVIDELARARVPDLEGLLEFFMHDPPRYIRVSTHLVSREELARRLARYGIECVPDEDLHDLLYVVKMSTNLTKTEEYVQGLYHIQDKSSVLVGHAILSDLRKLGKTLAVDVTGGPGGKITHVSQYGYHCVGVDLSWRRVKEIERHAKRMHIETTDYVRGDSLNIPLRLDKFRIILVDPECTGLGRLHHSPEVKMWISRRDLIKHSKLQRALLRKIVKESARDTVIYYCTCTMTLDENEHQIKSILEELNVELTDMEPFIGYSSPFLAKVQRLYPHLNKTTGFFIARLIKR